MQIPDSALIKRVIAAILVVLGVIGGTVLVIDTDGDGPLPARTVTIPKTVVLGGQGQKTVPLPPAAQQIAAEQKADVVAGRDAAAESGLRDEVAPSASDIRKGNEAAPDDQPKIPARVPLAAPQPPPGCFAAFVRNQSSRRGAKIALGVVHWTGSRNIFNSRADVLGNVRWFDTTASQASSSYITDDDGHCAYTVPETATPWTQVAANRWSLSIEVTNPGVLPLFHGSPGRTRVLQLMRRWHRLWGLPYRRGLVDSKCRPIRSGFLAHRDLGPCGGGHPDVGQSPATVDGLIRDAARGDRPITRTDRITCRKLNWWRTHGRPHGKPETNAVRRRKALTARAVTCTPTVPRHA